MELLLDKLTERPPGPAWPFKVTEPVDELPPTTVDGFKLTDDTDAGDTDKVADWD
jgi:hypothetical protein